MELGLRKGTGVGPAVGLKARGEQIWSFFGKCQQRPFQPEKVEGP